MPTQSILNAEAEGTPIVMVHGVGASSESWLEVARRLPADRPYVLYTLRGHETARSNPAPPYEMSDFVRDLFDVMDERGLQRAIIAGFSLGGLIAQAAALTLPDRVAALIVVGAVAGRTGDERERVLARYERVVETGPYEMAKESVGRWYTARYSEAHPEAGRRTLERMAALDPMCYAAAYRVLATNDFVHELHRIEAPVLAIAGAGDVGSPPHMAERIAAEVRNGKAVVVDDVKHELLEETASIVAKEIEGFVQDNSL